MAALGRRYIRKRGAVRKYGLTPDQVEEAVKRGLITDCKLGDDGELRINEEELAAKLEEIKRSLKAYLSLRELSSRKAQREAEKAL
ncbi:MAG: hypothetical protein LM576_00725 [Thermofilum sp.]|nr:hypothetical protein [Thermofilum sp.]